MKKVFISMACVLIALSGCTNGGSNKEYITDYMDIHKFNNEASVKLFFLICEYPCNL